jgi:thioredoxin 1
MRKIENTQEFEEAIQKGKIVIADFYADWCGPCQVQLPILEDLSKNLEEKVDIIKINVDQQQELARRFGVRSIPTLVFFQNQNAVETSVGLLSKDELQRKISALETRTN